MTTYLIYILKWALALTALYSLYGIFLRKETFHGLNRVVLLGILVGSLCLPMCHLSSSNGLSTMVQEVEQTLSEEAGILEQQAQESVLDLENSKWGQTPFVKSAEEQGAVSTSAETPSLWFVILVLVYFAGALFFWMRSLKGYVSLWVMLAQSKRVEHPAVSRHIHLMVNDKVQVPCSWMHWILVGRKDLAESAHLILPHEMEHIRRGHSFDMLMADLTVNVLWFLPFAHLLYKDLRDVHEYQADHAVVCAEVDADQYHQLLIRKAVMKGSSVVANSLNASGVKKRLTMMFRRQSSPLARLKVLYVLPLLGIVLMAFARPDIVEEMRQVMEQEEVKAEAAIEEVVAPLLADLPKVGEEVTPEPQLAKPHDLTEQPAESADQPLAVTDMPVKLSPEDSLALALQTREAEHAKRAEERRKARLKGPMAEDGLPILYDLPLNTNPNFLYGGVWLERRDNECLVHIVHTFEKDDEIYYVAGEDSYLQDRDIPSVLYKCRGTAVARAFDTQFHVSGMRGKTVDFTLIFPAIPEDYRYLNFIEVGSKEDRLSQSGYHFKSDLEPQTPAIRR